jgi:Family of unknown function (DUF6615)
MTWVATEKARRGMVREALADVLMDRAAWTYARLRAGRSRGVELHEETITQDLLLDISTVLPEISVKTFTRWQEARNGADWQWEWWFRGRRWFGLRVQAKRLKRLKTGQLGYDLGYQVGKKRRFQVDLLIEAARGVRAQAIYVLYNGPDLDLSRFTWGCGRLPASPTFFGVSILPATVARGLVAARTVDLAAVGACSRPWSCLVTCDPSSGCRRFRTPITRPPGIVTNDLAWWAARSYFRIVMQARSRPERDAAPESALDDEILASLQDQPPPYVNSLLFESVLADAVLPPGVGALTVFQPPTIS